MLNLNKRTVTRFTESARCSWLKAPGLFFTAGKKQTYQRNTYIIVQVKFHDSVFENEMEYLRC